MIQVEVFSVVTPCSVLYLTTPHGVKTQKTSTRLSTALKTSNLETKLIHTVSVWAWHLKYKEHMSSSNMEFILTFKKLWYWVSKKEQCSF